jgi:ubiquinone/menaquinone biosynthesis C-methylase UbiE
MDPDLRRQMLAYYDERAPEYEQAYTLGTGTASIDDPEVFKTEARELARIVEQVAHGRLMDLACGTAYWLPHYASNCSTISLFDQSARMLAESRAKATRLGLLERCAFLEGDFFEQRFEPDRYDTVLVGFFLSHLTEVQEPRLFDALRTMLSPGGRVLILDSAWSEGRARFNTRVERQSRRLNDGTPFEIYKRYCDREDVSRWARDYGMDLRLEFFGTAFFAASGHRAGDPKVGP